MLIDELRSSGAADFSPPKLISCIYFLGLRGEVVYVGQTADLVGRVAAHRLDKSFDEVVYFECDLPKKDKDNLEKEWIKLISPRKNVVHTERQSEQAVATKRILNERAEAAASQHPGSDIWKLDLPNRIKVELIAAGYTTTQSMACLTVNDLVAIRNIGPKNAQRVFDAASEFF